MIRVQEINDIAELAGFRRLWTSLWPRTAGATFFQSLDWLEVYWKHFGEGQRLRVLIVYRGTEPVGILPLAVRTETTRVGRFRVLTYPLSDWATFYGPIGPNPAATLSTGLSHIRQTRRDWDVLDLRWVDLDGTDRGRTDTAMRQAGFRPHRQAWDRTAMVEMQGTWDEYWAGRTKKWRHNVERCARRLAERGEYSLLRYRPQGAAHGDGGPRWDLLDACMGIAQSSWQCSSTTGTTLCHPCICSYVRDAHAAAARVGSLDLNLLLLAGRPVAFIYGYQYQGSVYASRTGFDPAFAALRPGLVLWRMVFEDGFRRGDSRYDLGVGSLPVKRHWQTSLATCYRYTHFPLAVPRAQLLRAKRWLQARLLGERDIACAQTA